MKPGNPGNPAISRQTFGQLPDGQEVIEHTLARTSGLIVRILSLGATVRELHAPDRHGRLADVVLGFASLPEYLGPHPYFGATIGRVAGRITHGRLRVDGKNYNLAINDPPNHLHGGRRGFDKRNWQVQSAGDRGNGPELTLALKSPDGEEGYPGNVLARVTYHLSGDRELSIHYEAETDRTTPLSLTHHSYFNLAGEGSGSIEGHHLQIFSDQITPVNEQLTLLGTRLNVKGHPSDLTCGKKLGDVLPRLLKMHGENYLVPHASPLSLERAARAWDPGSGRVLEAWTTQDCLQFYGGACMDGSLTGKTGAKYPKFGGFCLECQGYPDGVNTPGLGDILLRPGNTYRHSTVYRFSTI